MEYSICFYVSVVWSSAGGCAGQGAHLVFWLICKFDGFLSLWPVARLGLPPPAYVFLLLCLPLPTCFLPLCPFLLCEFCVCFVVLCCICICAFSFLLWPQTHTHFYLLCLCFSPSHSLPRSLPFSFFAGAFIYIRFLFSTLRCRRIYKYKWVLLDEG